METILIVVQLLVVIAMVVVILLQRSEGGGLGIGGGGGGGLVSVRGTANLLTRATAVLAFVFFVTSLSLAVIASNRSAPTSILDVEPVPTAEQPAVPTDQPEQPGEPGVPLSD